MSNKISNLEIKLVSAMIALSTVLIFGYSAFAATDSDDNTVSITLDASCNWSGTPWQSNLTVPDDAICVLEGIHDTTGYTVDITVFGDLNSNGIGGKLLIGPTSSTVTAITVDTITNNGTIEVGSGTNANEAGLITKTARDLIIQDTDLSLGFKPSLTTMSNTTPSLKNYITIGGNVYVGSDAGLATLTDGDLILNDADASNNVSNTSYGKTYVMGAGVLTNNAIFSTYQLMLGQYTGNKQGGTIHNSGTFNSTYNSAYSSATPGSQIHRGTFNNASGATATITNTLRITENTEKGTLENKGTFNTQFLRIGDQVADYNGGEAINIESGIFNITYSGTNYGMYVYKGQFENQNTNNYTAAPTSFNIPSYITVQGTDPTAGGELALIVNQGVVNHAGNLEIQPFGRLNLAQGIDHGGINSSRWVSTGTISTYGTDAVAPGNNGTINNASATFPEATLSAATINIGQNSTADAGNLINFGKIRRVNLAGTILSSNTAINMSNNSVLTNKNSGLISTYQGSITVGERTAAGRPVSTLTNDSGGQINGDTGGSGTFNIYADTNNANPAIINNTGKILYRTINATGGTINNYANPIVGDPDDILQASTLNVATAGIINNEENASITAGNLNIGNTSSPAGSFNQKEGTSAQAANIKTTVTGDLTTGQYGVLTNYDWITVAGKFDVGANPAASYGYKGNVGANNQVDSTISITGTTTFNGYATIEGTATDEAYLTSTGAITVGSTGQLTNEGTITGNATTTNPITVNGGKIYSGQYSDFTLAASGNAGILGQTAETTEIEIAGTVTTNNKLQMTAGTLCLGDFTSPSTCVSNSVTQTFGTITGSASANAIDTNILVGNEATLGAITLTSGTDTRTTNFTSHVNSGILATEDISISGRNTTMTLNGDLDQLSNLTSILDGADMLLLHPTESYNLGSVRMKNGDAGAPANASLLQVGNSTTASSLTIPDYHTCEVTTDNCALEINHINDTASADAEAKIDIYGTLTISTDGAASKPVYAGITNATQPTGRGAINVLANSSVEGSFVNSTSGNLIIGTNGRFDVDYGDATHIASAIINAETHIYGEDLATNTNRGLNVDGTFDCDTLLHLYNGGQADIGMTGVVTVNGSDTIVDDFMELDGTLNSGDLTIESTGVIASGGTEDGQTSSNFLINADSLDIQTGGQINSDNASTRLLGAVDGAGSNGGEGTGRSGGATPSDKIKFNMETIPYDTAPYGGAGMVSAGVDAKGGGAVRIIVAGSVNIDGTISANGGNSTNTSGGAGAGGTIIIKHTPTHASAASYEFTGSGTITANGGNSSTSGVPVGGGGKIYIDSIFLDNPDDRTYTEYTYDIRNIRAYGGANSANSTYAAAGTIVFMGDLNNPDGTLIVNQGAGRAISPAGPAAYIQNVGNTTFDRIEGNNGAKITWAAATTAPVVCYALNSSTVTLNGINCSSYYFPDKPAKVYINNSVTGAQTSVEPSGTGYEVVNDSKPVFSAKLLNPQNPAETISKVVLEVDDTSTFASPVWTGTILLGSNVVDGGQSVDFEYAGPQLAIGTPYYYRVKFLGAGDGSGLWNHRDWQDQYQFQMGDYVLITSTCTPAGTMSVTDTNTAGRPVGRNLYNADGDRYGYDSCDIDMTTSTTTWYLKYLKTAANFTDGTNILTPIDNAGADCSIDVSGNTAEEEYAYNVYTSDAQLTGTVQTNTTCSASYKCDASVCDNDDKYFNIEQSGSEDTVFTSTTGALTNAIFTLFSHINVGDTTVGSATPYQLGTRLLLLGPP